MPFYCIRDNDMLADMGLGEDQQVAERLADALEFWLRSKEMEGIETIRETMRIIREDPLSLHTPLRGTYWILSRMEKEICRSTS